MINILLKQYVIFIVSLQLEKKGLRIFWVYGLLNYRRFLGVFILRRICPSF